MAGKHRAPTTSTLIPRLVKVGTTGLVASTMPLVAVGNAEASEPILEAIAVCESGNQNIPTRGNSTASGFLQILDSTWKAYGGKEFAQRALHATRQEQFVVGGRILAGQGLGAWSESRGCWGKKVGNAKPQPQPQPIIEEVVEKPAIKTTSKPAPKPKPKPKPKLMVTSTPKTPVSTKNTAKRVAKSYLIKRGDTLSGIAVSRHTTVKRLANLNRDTVKNPDLIYAGNTLRLR